MTETSHVAIPDKIIRFLEERASIGFAGTRDRNLVPCGHRVSGWQIGAGGRTITLFVAPFSQTAFVESLLDNGAIAVTFADGGTHETYQIKGRYLSHRPVRHDEVAIADRSRDRFAKGMHGMYPTEVLPFIRASIPAPSVVVDVEVHEVFVQTPGPGAGSRIAPPPDAEVSAR